MDQGDEQVRFPAGQTQVMLARAPMRQLTSPWRARLEQYTRGAKLMTEFEAYAHKIGCKLVGDSIECDEAQSRKLATWWMENTNGQS